MNSQYYTELLNLSKDPSLTPEQRLVITRAVLALESQQGKIKTLESQVLALSRRNNYSSIKEYDPMGLLDNPFKNK